MRRSIAWLGLAVAVSGCASRGPRDVESRRARAVGADDDETTSAMPDGGGGRIPASPTPAGHPLRVLARVAAHALAVDGENVYFGADADDALLAVPKHPTDTPVEPRRIARHAPTSRALAYDAKNAALVWIASPGDLVLRVPTKGGTPMTLRESGIFADVAVADGDVFLSEAHSSGSSVMRITGTTVAQLTSVRGAPRGLATDADHLYIATSLQLAATTRTRGPLTELASGAAFASPHVDGAFVYATATAAEARSRSIVRIPKGGGAMETLAEGVRDAPIALSNGTLYWIDAERPRLRSLSLSSLGTAPALVARSPLLGHVTALTADAEGIYAAVGSGDDASVVVIAP